MLNYNEYLITEKINFSITKILDTLISVLIDISNNRKRKKIDKLEKSLKKNILSFKDNLIKSKNPSKHIKHILSELETKIEPDIIKYLNLETFFRGINIRKFNKQYEKEINKYFDDYLKTLKDRLLSYYDLNKNKFDDLEKQFQEYRKIKNKDKTLISKNDFEKEKTALHIELLKAMEWVKENNKQVLITCDGRDSAGKGSFIKIVKENSDPKYIKSETFRIPTEEDRKNWFKRYVKVLPKEKEIKLFDRSWYNRAVNDPAMKYCTEEEYMGFMNNVNNFENKLIDNDLILIKFWFMITKEKQEIKFALRKKSPLKYWKFSPNDDKARNKWDIFTKLRDQMFRKTSTKKSPWVIVDSNDKKLGQLNALRYILNKIPYENKNEKYLKIYPEIVYELKK